MRKEGPLTIIKFHLGVVLGLVLLFAGYGEAQERWTVAAETDPLRGTIAGIALSPTVIPTKPMGPYGEVKSQIAIRCHRGKTRIRIRFNQEPNLVGGQVSQRYAGQVFFNYRGAWDGDVKIMLLYHAPGERFIQYENSPLRLLGARSLKKKGFLSRMSKHREFRLETRWSGLEETYFVFPLAGARESIRKCREIGRR